MKLIWSGASPYARKVMIVAHELGIAERIEKTAEPVTPVAPNPEVFSHNPLGKLPCLILENDPAIYDSRVICQYLIGLAPGQKLLPEGAARWRAMTLEALGDGICDAAILLRYETFLRDEKFRWPEWIEGQMGKIDRALDSAEAVWTGHLAGPFDLGHAALGAALSYLDFRFADKDWRSGRPGLTAWHEGFGKRESAIATAPQA